MGSAEAFGSLAELIDRRAPGFVRFVAALRWGGLRTVRPGPLTWSAESVAALGLGLGLRSGAATASRGRIRVPLGVAGVVAVLATHLSVWRWDTLRWRRRRVALVVDLPVDDLIELVDELDAVGLPVERWERGMRAGRRVHGLWCRTGDVRAVNRAIDAVGAVSR